MFNKSNNLLFTKLALILVLFIMTKNIENFAFAEFQCDVDGEPNKYEDGSETLNTNNSLTKTIYDRIEDHIPPKEHVSIYVFYGVIFISAMWASAHNNFE